MAISEKPSRNYHSVIHSSENEKIYSKLPDNLVFKYDFKKLRKIAQKQIYNYGKQIAYHSDKRFLYIKLINKLILHESLIKIFKFYRIILKGVN